MQNLRELDQHPVDLPGPGPVRAEARRVPVELIAPLSFGVHPRVQVVQVRVAEAVQRGLGKVGEGAGREPGGRAVDSGVQPGQDVIGAGDDQPPAVDALLVAGLGCGDAGPQECEPGRSLHPKFAGVVRGEAVPVGAEAGAQLSDAGGDVPAAGQAGVGRRVRVCAVRR
ncbi:hypothetical protein [Amycolatopsis sp. FDAARGOS 1241]|uniref:hypothetical protein n=1 Tax=Amycolatopsis sp. FDAARGOS 1241 TaxID=2778070 RepID=UPI0019520418|nr:hypothetical protein [Amycolatopsis sp. FDAARGOS 1241]QRP47960.1 hypothetical protein I6J71_08740 [Amycolatopsis sp. FDAARGOS 1241]